MKVLFDEDVPGKLARLLPRRHEIHTVVTMRWGGIKNGALLELIGQTQFDVFLTGDKNMESQQRLEGRSFAVLVMSAINWPVVKTPCSSDCHGARRRPARYGEHDRLRRLYSPHKA